MANNKYIFVDQVSGFNTEDKVSVSSFQGVGGADSLVKTDATGKIDNSLINFAAFNSVFAVRTASNTNLNLAAPGASVGGVTMNVGDRFLAYGQTTQSQNGIYVFQGAAAPATRAPDYDQDAEVSAGDLVVVSEGTFAERAYILATNDTIVVGTSALVYSPLGTSLIDAGDGLSYSGTTLNVNPGTGVIISTDTVAVDFADPATQLNSARAIKASDLSNAGANQGAKIIGYDNTNTAGYTTATRVQQAIDDAFALAAAPGDYYTVGAGGVTKGQLVYISANNTVLPFTDISQARNAVGLAATTVAAAGSVKVVEISTTLTGVLSGATAGTKYFWTGSTMSTTIPPANSSYVWAVGVAKNATDLKVKVEFVKRNSAS